MSIKKHKDEAKQRLPTLNDLLNTPYRYACPSCERRTLRVRRKLAPVLAHAEAQRTAPMRWGTLAGTNIHNFICSYCGECTDTAYDYKRDEERTLQNEHPLIGGR